MNSTKKRIKRISAKVCSCLAAAMLALDILPMNLQAEDIDDKIAAGSYVEGEVIAAIMMDGDRSEDKSEAELEAKLQEESDESIEVTGLITVDSAAACQAAGDEADREASEKSSYSVKVTTSLSDSVKLCIVRSDTMSTEELLRELADDPNVVFAEPNYILELNSIEQPDEEDPEDRQTGESVSGDPEDGADPEGAETPSEGNTEQETADEGKTAAGANPEAEASQGEAATEKKTKQKRTPAQQPEDGPLSDLTPLQWGNWTTDQTIRLDGMNDNPSINVPNFGAEGKDGNMDKPIVVALIDTGVYPEHPDLVNVVYRFSPEQQAALGCWEWGFNATDKGTHGNVRDEASIGHGHGTHTAGIIGAEWNGFGTSGVASNVKIVCIQIADASGNETLADALAAFDFVNRFNEQASEDERIRVTSNSWGEHTSSLAIDAVVRDLGERWGIVSVFSSGNDEKNNDHYEKMPSTMADNPYAIVVANTTTADRLYSGSEYGRTTVDLAAPGTNILSTAIPDHSNYYPDAVRDNNLLYFSFDGDDEIPIKISQVYADGNPEICDEESVVRENIAERTSEAHFYGTGCLKIEIDPAYVVSSDVWATSTESYDLQFDIDLADTGIAERLEGIHDVRLGFAYGTESGSESVALYASTNAAFVTESAAGEETVRSRPVIASNQSFNFSDNGIWGSSDFIITKDKIKDEEGEDPDVAAVSPEDDILSVKVRIKLPKEHTTIYIDSLGIGTQTAPYEYATGTSMSCPAVAGGAAVLASRGYEGIELASLVRSMVRIPDSGELAVRSGGVFDFNVSGSPDSGESGKSAAPVINNVVVSGTSLTVTGQYFGKGPGPVALDRYVVGADLQPAAAKVVSWSDTEVQLELEKPAEGILRVRLKNAGGKYDTHMRFASKSANVYEQDLPFDADTGDAYVFDGNGDWETRGPLVGLSCKLYYLPAYCGKEDEHPAYRRMQCFDLKTKTWSDLPDLPEWLEDISAVMYDGKIVVEGASMYVTDVGEPSGSFPEGESQERVYVYDPAAGAWSQGSSEGMVLGQSIVNDQGQLKLVGGGKPDPENPYLTLPVPVMVYDVASGAGEELCDMTDNLMNPVAAAKDGTILIYSAANHPVFYRVQGGEAVKLEEAVPDFYLAEEGEPINGTFGNVMRNPYLCVLAPVAEGFVLVGPPETGGASDTYILRDGSDKFEAYEKRSSDDRVYSQAGTAYRGRLFLIGTAWGEPEMRLFRATKMDVPEYPGDIPCEEKIEPSEDDDKPSEDVKPLPDDANKPADSSDKRKKRDNVPNTGDEMPFGMFFVSLAIAVALGVLRARYR